MTFSEALELIKEGFMLKREGWNGKGMHIALQTPTDKSKMTQPYIYIKTAQGGLVPWIASQSDILAEDWESNEGHGDGQAFGYTVAGGHSDNR